MNILNKSTNNFSQEDLKKLQFEYEAALQVLKTHLEILIKDYDMSNHTKSVEHVNARIKSIDSALGKLEKRNYDITLENLEEHIHDMVGVRLVCPFEDDVYEMVDLIKSSDLLQVCHEKDYIENPKESGYSSYHIIVKVPVSFKDDIEFIDAEIQVRTLAMDAWAALEHELQYKSNGSVTKRERDELRECAQEFRRIENKMLILKKGLR